jgi:16S rRNA C967 or C1407 C5-methylase (RsmB/RsmF family)/NOL1/NOP2/fmu family ribosome biogenesis protein
MKNLPASLMNSLTDIEGFDKESFEAVHLSGEQITSIRINAGKSGTPPIDATRVPWCETGYYLSERPSFTFDPLFHAGCYYVQEASSMFLEQALRQTIDLSKPVKVLDLCAAPGGKSTHIQSLISKESLLVSNEVIRSRANILKDNIIKWGCQNVMVTHNDPQDFAALKNYFDVMVVDAPCSGSGLFRREPEAIEEWSLSNVQLCSRRQQRILADAWPSLKENAVLIYSTCSYSVEEDEQIMDWISQELAAVNIPLDIDKEWGIVKTVTARGNEGYRFWPDKVRGEGFFLTCFRKTSLEESAPIRVKQGMEKLSKKEMMVLEPWLQKQNERFLFKNQDTVYAWPGNLTNDFNFLLKQLRVLYSGTIIGAIVREKLIPDHSLAMSCSMVNEAIPSFELDREKAIQYLQRKEFSIEEAKKGWALVNFRGKALGWMNVLPNRINNYYPKELRILKDG